MRFMLGLSLAAAADVLRFQADLLGAASRKVIGR